MGIIKESWQGKKPLATVFWGYYVGFHFLYLVVLGGLVSALPENIQLFVIIPGALFLFPYTVWVFVSIWRCAKNSRPVWKVLAIAWVVLAIIGFAGNVTFKYIENYQYYSERAKADASSQNKSNKANLNYQGWLQEELNEKYMASITKDDCVIKTSISIDECKSQQCIKTLGGIFGDCITFAKGSESEFCQNFESKYLQNYCADSDTENSKCLFFQVSVGVLCGAK